MGFDAIETAVRAALTASSSYSTVNTAWLDMGVLDTSPCRWSAVTAPGPMESGIMSFGSSNHGVTWTLLITVWLKFEKMDTWQEDTKTIMQDTMTAILDDDTLGDTCVHTEIRLVDVSPVSHGGKRYDVFSFQVDPEEWDL